MFVQKKRRSSAVDLAAGSGEVRPARTLLTVDRSGSRATASLLLPRLWFDAEWWGS